MTLRLRHDLEAREQHKRVKLRTGFWAPIAQYTAYILNTLLLVKQLVTLLYPRKYINYYVADSEPISYVLATAV